MYEEASSLNLCLILLSRDIEIYFFKYLKKRAKQ